jgi:hypothetical protein
MRRRGREYFIVTRSGFRHFQAQDDLRAHLESTFPVVARTNDFIIYDLRSRAPQAAS